MARSADDKLFLCFNEPGGSWVAGTPTREQPRWDEHAAFIDDLFDRGRIMIAGPYADWSGALVVARAASSEAARALFDADPWHVHDILQVTRVQEWVVFLDDRPHSD